MVLWKVERRVFGDTHQLKVGDTEIGRDPNADIITKSVNCSRQHCTVTLNSDDSIFITNKVRMDYFFGLIDFNLNFDVII